MAAARRIGRIAAWALAGLAGLAVALLATALIVLNTGAGGAWAARTVSDLARTPDAAVRIGSLRLRGLDLAAADIALADRDGVWLRVGRVGLAWHPLALLSRRLDITRLAVADVAVLRKPLPGPPKPERQPGGFSVPHLPVTVRVGALQVAPIEIGAPVLGEAMTLRVDGALGVHDDQAIRTRATIQRTDAPGRVALAATFRPERPSLDLALSVDEPAGGLIGRLAKLPGTPPVSIRVEGAGPLDDWHGRLNADLPGLVQASGTLGGDLRGPGRVTGALAAAFGPLMPEQARQALGARADLSLAATLGADRSVAIDSLALATPNLRADLKGRIAPADERIDGLDLTLAVPDGTKLKPLLGQAAFAAAQLAVHASGPFDAPEVTVALDAEDAAAEGVGRLPHVTLRGKAVAPVGPDAPGAVPVTLALRLDKPALDQAALGNLLGAAPTLDLTAEWARDDKVVRIGALTLKGRAIDLGASGTYALADKSVDAKLTLAVTPLSVAAPGAEGSARATIAVKGALTGALVADVRAQAERLAYPAVPAVAVLGRNPTLSGHFERQADGAMRLDDLKLDGAQVAITAEDCRIADAVACVVRGRLDSLGPLAPKGGTALAGRAEFALDARGPRADPVVTLRATVLDGRVGTTAFGALLADARVENPAGDAKGRLGVALTAPAGEAKLDADFALTERRSILRVSNLGLVAPGLGAKGTLTVRLKDKLAQGTLDLRVDDAGKVAALAGMTARGQADAHVALSTPGGQQAAQVTLRAAKLRVETAPGGDVIRLAAADLRAEATDLFGTAGRLSAALRATGIATPTARLNTLSASARGPLSALAVHAAVDGQIIQPTGPRPLALTLDGQVARAAGGVTTVRLDRLDGKALDIPIALRRPARITLGAGATKVDGLALGLAEGTITVDASVSAQAIDANLGLRKLPASLASAARPDLHLAGTLDGSASLAGRPGGGQGRFNLRFQDLRVLSTGDETDALSGAPTLAGSADGRWDGRQAQIAARIAGLSRTDAIIRATVPLAAPPDSAVPALVKTAPLSAHVDWQGPIGPLWSLVPAEEHRLTGNASVVVDVAGTAATPRIAADIRLANGHYEHLVWGTELERMTLNARADAGGNLDATLEATDGAKGTLTARARVGLNQPGQPVDATIDLKSFLVARRDDATVMTDAHITASGPAKSARIEGQVTTDKVEIALTASLPPSVVTLDVDQVNGPPHNGAPRLKPRPGTIRIRGPLGPPPKAAAAPPAPTAADQAEAAARAKPAPAAAMPLMLRIRMPNAVFVRGRGLESEWKGNLRIEGTSAAPRIFGALQIVRGDLTLAGKTLGLDDSSTITFPGTTSVDPLLNLTANLEQSDLTAALHVTGRASQPKIELSSTPALPQDEILAHMLFDKSASELSPFEAVQLASAAAELSGALGSGPGVMGKLRSGLGLDVLRFQNNSEGQATVGAGKYVSKRVYIGVQQGLDASSGQVTVNIDITKHLSVETDVGAASNSRAGVNWKYDY